MSTFQEFPDMEAIVIDKVTQGTDVEAFDAIPSKNRPNEFAIIHGTGGPPLERHKWDAPDLHFDVYAESKSRARYLAQHIRASLMIDEGSRWTHSTNPTITAFVSKVSDSTAIQWLHDPLEIPLLVRYIFSLRFICSR